MATSQSTRLPSNPQHFLNLVSYFLDELDTDERVDAMIACQRFLAHFPASEQADAVSFFWRAYPGFNGWVREYNAIRFARAVALSNAGTDTPRSAWERRAYAAHAGKEHKVSTKPKLTTHRRKLLRALADGAYFNVVYQGGGYKEYYEITWVPDFFEANVTPATIDLFKANGWIEEVDGTFSGSVYVITAAGRRACELDDLADALGGRTVES